MSYRDTMVAWALAYRDVGMASPNRAQYLDLIAAGETPAMADQMGRMSGCGLVIRGYLRLDGCQDPRVRAPYQVQTAIACLLAMAREKGALVIAAPSARPLPGDMVLVGGSRGDGGSEHVFVLTSIDQDALVSVDGGQVDGKGLQIIRERRRTWGVRDGRLWDHPVDGAARRIQCWIDLEKLRE